MSKIKKCIKCGIEKVLNAFQKRNATGNNLRGECRDCAKILG